MGRRRRASNIEGGKSGRLLGAEQAVHVTCAHGARHRLPPPNIGGRSIGGVMAAAGAVAPCGKAAYGSEPWGRRKEEDALEGRATSRQHIS